MNRKKSLIIVGLLFIVFLVIGIILLSSYDAPKTLIGDSKTLKEIDRLLLPLDTKTLTEIDLNDLKEMVKSDEYASREVEELILLTKYKEYSHVGHGLAFLYEYVQTGEEPVCPGHLLSHYYVFIKHGEIDTANDNLAEAKATIPEWKNIELTKNETYLAEINYSSYVEKFNFNINKIEGGNSTATEEEISDLADAPCAR